MELGSWQHWVDRIPERLAGRCVVLTVLLIAAYLLLPCA